VTKKVVIFVRFRAPPSNIHDVSKDFYNNALPSIAAEASGPISQALKLPFHL
jgi:hypothetical protein